MSANGWSDLRYVTGDLVDHHCHGLVLRDLDRPDLESLLNEAEGSAGLGTTVFDSMIGLAVRRWCAPVLGLDPLSDADTYLTRRRELGVSEVNERLVAAAGVTDFVVDTGYEPEPISSAADVAALAGGRGHQVVRLERIAQQLLTDKVPAGDFAAALSKALDESTAVGAKSIAAYRVGLRLPAVKPSEAELVAALDDVQPQPDGSFRIAHPVVNGYLAWAAIEAELPLQFHVGYGDSDVDLRECDPLLLTGFLRATQERGVPVLLLHNYPFHRQASYLAQVFGHVFMDVGLAVHNLGALSDAVVRESLELVPFGKMLYSSDAFGLPELYYLGSLLFRRALSQVLESLVESAEMGDDDAEHVSRLISSDNARRVYRLDPAR